MNKSSPELETLLRSAASGTGQSLIGLVVTATLATSIVGWVWHSWIVLGRVAADLEMTVRQQGAKLQQGPDLYGLDLARYMDESRTVHSVTGLAAALGGYAVSVLFLFNLRFKRRLRRLLSISRSHAEPDDPLPLQPPG